MGGSGRAGTPAAPVRAGRPRPGAGGTPALRCGRGRPRSGAILQARESKLVEGDLAAIDLQGVEHREGGLDHGGRAAEIVFDGRGIGMAGEIVFEQDFVDQSGMRSPIIFRQRRGKGEVEAEIGELPEEILEVSYVKLSLSERAPYQKLTRRAVFSVSKRYARCERSGAMPAPPPR